MACNPEGGGGRVAHTWGLFVEQTEQISEAAS